MGIVCGVSVDLVARLRRRFSMAALVGGTDEILRELLGDRPCPELTVHTDRRYERGVRIADGRRLSAAELHAVVVGADLAGPEYGRFGPRYEIEVGDTGDGAWFVVGAFTDVRGERVEAICSPRRTCVGVVVATAVALAAAERGGGEFVDIQVAMLRPPVQDPRDAIASMRLTDPGTGFLAQCARFMRQYEHLNGWPPNPARA
jgi:hypothetical protein